MLGYSLHCSFFINYHDKTGGYMIYQLKEFNLKKACNQKYLCNKDKSGKLNQRAMLSELCVARGLFLIGGIDNEPILEDLNGAKFKVRFRGEGELRWLLISDFKLTKTKVLEPFQPAELPL